MKKIWKKWTNLTKKIAYHFANFSLAIMYFVIIIPFAWFIQTFFKNSLRGHKYTQRENSFWIKRQKIKQDLAFAKEQ